MLTTMQNQFAPCLPDPQERRAYATHMCGLCHTLGDRYGLLARMATSHELILLNLLTSAQRADEPVTARRRCPLNPLRLVPANRDVASEFAAAVAIELANVKFGDDVQDSAGRDAPARLGRWLAHRPRQAALRVLRDLRFDVEILERSGERQAWAEADETQDPAGPSALVGAELFSTTARLAGRPENTDALAAMGGHYGAYIYWLDAYRDFARDMARGDYNPLRRFGQRSAQVLTLSQAGLEWLSGRLKAIQYALGENVPKLRLHRHHGLVLKLLCGPVDKVALELSHRLQRGEPTFRRARWAEVLKAGLFFLPVPEGGASVASARTYQEMPGLAYDPEREHKRGTCQDLGYGGGNACYYCDSCGHVPCGNPSPGGADSCGQMDSSGCGHMDLSSCGHVDLGHCGPGDPGSFVDCTHCGNVDLSGCSGMDCSGVDCGGCGN